MVLYCIFFGGRGRVRFFSGGSVSVFFVYGGYVVDKIVWLVKDTILRGTFRFFLGCE